MSTAAATLGRDVKIISLIGFAHFFSHFFQLALAPLFIMIHVDRGFSYTSLGLLIGLFYAASAFFQPPTGFLVDRFGARKVLFAGLGLMSLAMVGYGALPYYPVMAVLAVVSGIGNSVFHPADYSVLSATIDDSRVGRAFSAHNFLGFIGYAAAPLVMVAAGGMWGWRAAVIGAGLIGLIALVILVAGSGAFRDSADVRRDSDTKQEGFGESISILFTAPILLCFLFFLMVAMGQIGLQNFSPTILIDRFDFSETLANGAVTAMLVGVPIGILIGGIVADRLEHRHDAAIALSFGMASVFVLIAGFAGLPNAGMTAAYFVAGVTYGIAFPSRDVVVRGIAPATGTGKVFGFVYAGLDTGSAVTPIMFGWLVDNGLPLGMFLVVAGLWAGAVLVVLATGRAARLSRA